MKLLRAAVFVLISLSACASSRRSNAPAAPATTPSADDTPSAPVTELRRQSRSELERQELERPADAELKLELARRSWCTGARGPAVEGWLWVRQFAAKNPKAVAEARSHIADARKNPDALEDRLECGDIQSAERK